MSNRKLLSTTEIEQLVIDHPELPSDYLEYLSNVGWGEAASGHIVYSGPIQPDEVYPQLINENQRVVLGDDCQGYCLGYDFASKTYGEYSDSGEWTSFSDDFALALLLS